MNRGWRVRPPYRAVRCAVVWTNCRHPQCFTRIRLEQRLLMTAPRTAVLRSRGRGRSDAVSGTRPGSGWPGRSLCLTPAERSGSVDRAQSTVNRAPSTATRETQSSGGQVGVRQRTSRHHAARPRALQCEAQRSAQRCASGIGDPGSAAALCRAAVSRQPVQEHGLQRTRRRQQAAGPGSSAAQRSATGLDEPGYRA